MLDPILAWANFDQNLLANFETNGNYSFPGLGPGAYRVRELPQVGWTQTTANPADIQGASGQLDFDPATGEAPGAIELWQVDGGVIKPVTVVP